LEYRNLGRSGLKVSVMSLGTNAFGPRSDEPTAIAVVHAALDAGINLIDTADIYANGESERMIGLALNGRRSQAVLATKFWNRMGPGPNDRGGSRLHIINAVEASLRRLQTDFIDLYQIHNFDAETPLEETLHELDQLVRSGKVRYIGCSNFAAWQIVKALGISDRNGWVRFISHQPEYSLLNRKIEREVIPACLSEGVGNIVYFPLAAGVLTGKYRKGEPFPLGSRAEKAPQFAGRWLTDRNLDTAERLRKVAAEAGLTLSQLSLAWPMAKPGVASVIAGASRPEQVTENVSACALKLSADLVRQADELTAEFTD
jgi:1-deoxyxylulose-5-phosphate synthase